MEHEIEPAEQRTDRRGRLVAGGVAALGAGLGLAFVIMSRDEGSSRPPPASQGGLVVQATRVEDDEAMGVNKVTGPGEEKDRKHVERELDHGLKETFPASDPVSINPGAD